MDKRAKLIADLQSQRERGLRIGLGKSTSNLFRHRDRAAKIDVRHFNRVLHVDPDRLVADVEGMTTYADFVDETLKHGLLPTVVPQLKSITVGGAVSGLGIESSSFRFGLVHETVVEMEVLLADGSIVVCSPTQNEDLFYGFPNSYGTLGYVLRLRVMLIPARPFVHLTHESFREPARYFERIAQLCAARDLDYLDGVVFGRDEMYLTKGQFTEEAAHLSDYTYLRIFYKSIREKNEDWLTAKHYIWRWDTDWFWCSKHFYVQHPAIRLLATKWALNSITYQRIMRLSRHVLPQSNGTESVIQDVDIPIEHAEDFLQFLLRDIGITPVWICPFKAFNPAVTFDLYALDPNKIYINFGFWDVVPSAHEHGFFNRKVEAKAFELGGKKGLYSTAYYDEETFWKIYDKERYFALKRKYDPTGVFQDLYAKCTTR